MKLSFAQLRNILTAFAVGSMSAVVLVAPAGMGTAPANAVGDVYICHATGVTPRMTTIEQVPKYEVNSPSSDGDVSGHAGVSHQNGLDIIPPVPEHNFPGQNWTTYGQEVYYNLDKHGDGCNVPVNDATASVDLVSAATCSSPSLVEFSMTNATSDPAAPATAPGTNYSVTFTSEDGHRFSDGNRTKTLSYNIEPPLPASEQCPVNDAVASVSTTPATCSSPTVVTFSMTNATSDPAAPATAPGTNYSVTFTSDSGHRFADASRTKTETYTIQGKLDPDHDLCADGDAVAAVSVAQPTCQLGSQVAFTMTNATANPPQPSTQLGDHKVTFTADSGYRFVEDGDRVKTIEVDYRVADKLDPDNDLCADGDAVAAVSVELPTCQLGSQVAFTMTNATANPTVPSSQLGDHTVTFTADSGYRFVEEDGDRVKTIEVDYRVADKLDPDNDLCADGDAVAAVSVEQPTCQLGSQVAFTMTNATANPTVPSSQLGDHTVTFTADSGYRFVEEDGDRVKTIEVDYRVADKLDLDNDLCADGDAVAAVSVELPTCELVSQVGFTMTDATATPAEPDQSVGLHSVTFTADSGYRFVEEDGDRVKTIEVDYRVADKLDLDNDLCADGDAVAAVSVELPTCELVSQVGFTMTNATATPAEPDQSVGLHSVTFTADSGHRFVDDNLNRVRTLTVPYTVDDRLGADDDRCAKKDAVAEVTTTPSTCLSGETLEYGEITHAAFTGTEDGTSGPSDFEVIATADSGHRFADGDRTETFEGSLAGPLDPDSDLCAAKDAAVQLSTTPASCGVGETLVLGNTLHATWGLPTLWEGPGQYAVTATADPNYRFADGMRTKTFTGKLDGPLADNNGPNFPGCDRTAQPEPTTRQVSDSEAGCALQDVGGVATWTDEWSTTYEWSDETGWTGVETGPVRIAEDFTPYTDEEYFADCVLPRPADLTLHEEQSGCDLTEFGAFDAGTIRRTGDRDFVWNLTERDWELEDLADVSWSDWTQAAQDVLTDEEYFEDCAAGQPAAEIRQASGTEDSCELRGTLAWTDTFTAEYVWDAELRTWALSTEGEPVREEQLKEWSFEKYERLCVEVAPAEGEVQVMDNELDAEVEVKGVQQTAAPTVAVPTAVDAGLGTTPFTPVGVRRNPLALVALGGGLLLLGAAGRRKGATAVR